MQAGIADVAAWRELLARSNLVIVSAFSMSHAPDCSAILRICWVVNMIPAF